MINKTYKSIGEIAKDLNLIDKKTGKTQTHTLRYWEKQFKQIKPSIKAGKRRYYNHKDFLVIKKIKNLLKNQGLTVNGVKKFLDNNPFNIDDDNKFIVQNRIKFYATAHLRSNDFTGQNFTRLRATFNCYINVGELPNLGDLISTPGFSSTH